MASEEPAFRSGASPHFAPGMGEACTTAGYGLPPPVEWRNQGQMAKPGTGETRVTCLSDLGWGRTKRFIRDVGLRKDE